MIDRTLRVGLVDPEPVRRDILAETMAAASDLAVVAAARFVDLADPHACDVLVAAAEADAPTAGFGPILAAIPILILHPADVAPPDWADAALARPARPAALLAAIKAAAAKAGGRPTALPGGLLLDVGGKCLSDGDGRAARLTEKEAAALAYLAAAAGPVGREELLARVWGYAPDADSHTVETHIHRLRRKLDGFDASVRLITDPGGGYRLAAEGMG